LSAPARKETLFSIIQVTTGPVRARSAALTVQPSARKIHNVRYAGQPALCPLLLAMHGGVASPAARHA
jgi:hypothetical protein